MKYEKFADYVHILRKVQFLCLYDSVKLITYSEIDHFHQMQDFTIILGN